MKKIIRLTESDFHNIIAEAVTKILTELDWQTYASAGDKRRKQAKITDRPFKNRKGQTDADLKQKADDLYRHGGDMFNKQYELDTDDGIDKAALDYMAFAKDEPLSREYDPYTHKYEINGLDKFKRHYKANKDEKDYFDDKFNNVKKYGIGRNNDDEEEGDGLGFMLTPDGRRTYYDYF